MRLISLSFLRNDFLQRSAVSKIAPIAAVMLLEAVAFATLPQHLSGKRDGCFLVVGGFASKKDRKNIYTFVVCINLYFYHLLKQNLEN